MTVWHQEWGCMTLCQHKTIWTELKELDLIQFFATMESSLEPAREIQKACLYSIYVKTAEPIWPKFIEGPHVAPGKVYEWSKFQKFETTKFDFHYIF